MHDSILNSTKKILGISADYTAFDLDITTHINSSLSTLNQLGVGPLDGFSIEDSGPLWSDIGLSAVQINLVRTFIFLTVRMLFDPPTTSFLISAMEKQIEELTWRISTQREWGLNPVDPMLVQEVIVNE